MSTQASLVLNDGLATPVARTFVPRIPYGGPNQPAVWVYKAGVSPLAWPRIEVTMKRTTNGSTKVTPKVVVPYVTNDAVAGPKLVSTCYFDAASGGFIIPDVALQATIDDTYGFAMSLMANAVFKTWVRDLEAAY